MNIAPHLNLIYNHNYPGRIAIYHGGKNLSISDGDIVLVQKERITEPDCNHSYDEVEWLKRYKTIEKPMSEEQIQEQKGRGSGLMTFNTCVGVPVQLLEMIDI